MSATPARVVTISTATIVKVVAVILGLALLWFIRDIVLLLFAALLLAGVMYPLVASAGRYHIPRGLSVIVLYVILFGLMALAFALLVPALADQARSLLVTYGAQNNWFSHLLKSAPWPSVFGLNNAASLPVGSPVPSLGVMEQGLADVLGVLPAVFGGLAEFVVVLVLAFYLIVEESALEGFFKQMVPAGQHALVTRLLWQVIDKLGGWMRGQFLLVASVGVLYFAGLSVLQMPYALLLALFAGLLEFIPYLGPLIAAVPMLFLAASMSPARALLTLAFLVAMQQLEGHVLVPQIMRKTVGLNPIVSVVAFAAGVKLFGLAGAIFSIPLATAASVVLADLMQKKLKHTPA